MTGGQLGSTWLAACPTLTATVEMWRAWIFGPLPVDPEPEPTPTGRARRGAPTAGAFVDDEDAFWLW